MSQSLPQSNFGGEYEVLWQDCICRNQRGDLPDMKVIPIPCSFDNYAYLLVCEKSGEAAIVDPAEYYPIQREINNYGVELKTVFCTHHHADHIGGLEELMSDFPRLEIFGHACDSSRIPGMNRTVNDGDLVTVGDLEGRVLATPGHTLGSVCYQLGECLFTGDTLFGGGCGRLFEGTPEQMYSALCLTIKTLPEQTMIYFGHEYTVQNMRFAVSVAPEDVQITARLEEARATIGKGGMTTPSTLKTELVSNPFLRCDQPEFVEGIATKYFLETTDPLSIFTRLRSLKDNF